LAPSAPRPRPPRLPAAHRDRSGVAPAPAAATDAAAAAERAQLAEIERAPPGQRLALRRHLLARVVGLAKRGPAPARRRDSSRALMSRRAR
jgi:hypothetical protein